jgi:hypothetical protein
MNLDSNNDNIASLLITNHFDDDKNNRGVEEGANGIGFNQASQAIIGGGKVQSP